MARKVFYSFHYDNDIMRVMIVRNRWVTMGNQEASQIIDKAEFEKIKRTGENAVKNWIDKQLQGTTATIVLLGTETLHRPFVQYEICESHNKKNAILGIHICNIKDPRTGRTATKANTHIKIGVYENGNPVFFDEICDGIYDYVLDDGYHNLGIWVDYAVMNKSRG